MKNKEIVLYDDTANYEKEDETREFLFDVYADEEGWKDKDDIPEERVYDEIDWQNEMTWKDVKDALVAAFKKDYFIMMGTCGRWNGTFAGGNFITDYRDFQDGISHLDTIKITDVNGHFIVEGYHHDGQDRYELKRLTGKGYRLATINGFAHDRRLHTAIMKCNVYSTLPRIAQKVYGL